MLTPHSQPSNLVEIERGTLTRVAADGAVSVIADLGGGRYAELSADGSDIELPRER